MSDHVAVRGKVAAAAALAGGKTKADAARAAGVTTRTIHRWLQDDDFRGQVAERRAELLDQALGALSEAAGEAVATLREALSAPPSQARATGARVAAARAILSMLVPLKEVLDIEERLVALEAEAEERRDR
jgi:hypothetical protein